MSIAALPYATALDRGVERLLAPAPLVRGIGADDLDFVAAVAPLAHGAARSVAGWGRAGDGGVIAFRPAGVPVGAAWFRLHAPAERGGGIVAWRDLPEAALAVRDGARDPEVAGTLLAALIGRARAAGFRRLALALEPDHAARPFFHRYRFREAATSEPSLNGRRLLIAEIA